MNLNPSVKWIPICNCCGMRGGGSTETNTTKPPMFPPSMSGSCPASFDGKHKPKWERG